MFHALDLGMSASDFWDASPRAVLLIQQELQRAKDASQKESADTSKLPRLRLSDLPRP